MGQCRWEVYFEVNKNLAMDEFASEAYYGRRELRHIQEIGRLALLK